MNAIGIGAVCRRGAADVVHHDSNAVVKPQMALRAVLDRYASYRHIETPIESKCLHRKSRIQLTIQKR